MELINKNTARSIFENLDNATKEDISFRYLEAEDHELTFDEFYEYLCVTLESNVEYDTHISIMEAAEQVKEPIGHIIPEKGYISIPLGNDISLIAESNTDNGIAEMMVFTRKSDGTIQDLARVGQEVEYSEKTQDLEAIPGQYYIMVYVDETDEDYTYKFHVKEYKGEE